MISAPRAPAGKLPFRQSFGYGVGAMAHQVFDSGIGYLAFYVFNIALGVSPVMVGLAQSLSRGVDLFTDPLAGYLADSPRWRSSRRTMIVIGSLVGGIFFSLVWLFPAGLSPTGYFFWLLGCFSITSAGWSFCSVPRQAIGIEMTSAPNERAMLNALASFMGMVCNLGMVWAYAATQLPIFGGTVNGARWVGGAMGAAIIVFGIISAVFCKTKELTPTEIARAKPSTSGIGNFTAGIRRVSKCRPFLFLALAVMLVIVGLISTSYGVTPCIAIYYICGGSQSKAAIIMGGGSTLWITSGLLFTPVILWLARRFGKRDVLIFFLLLGLAGDVAKWICYNPSFPWLFIIPKAAFGAAIAAVAALAPSMTADACDVEETLTGACDSGMFSAFYNWTLKLGISLGIALTGLLLNSTGFLVANGANQSTQTLLNLRLMDIAVPAVTIAGAVVFLMKYSINNSKMESVRIELEQRRMADTGNPKVYSSAK
ncbi:MAG: hypothetical protein JWM32_223 [Verrucomicrobia bacterium]|nr:hypothetical protein [Verrucomicrobiota bacterium]